MNFKSHTSYEAHVRKKLSQGPENVFLARNRCRRLQLCKSLQQVTRGANGEVAHLGFNVSLSYFEEEERKKDFSV